MSNIQQNIENFNSQFDNIFKKAKNKEELRQNINSNEDNFLYLFDIDYYYDGSKQLPENTCKLGMTIQPISLRLNGYNSLANIRNIEYIQCSNPIKKERLVKCFLKHKTNFVPVVGTEYFTNCRYIIKLIYIVLHFIEDSDIEIAYNYYDKKYKKYNILLNYIYSIYENVINNINFNLQEKIKVYNDEEHNKQIDNISNKILSEQNIEKVFTNTDNTIFVCEYCKKEYTTISNLKHHQRTAQFCLEIQNQITTGFKCEHCDKKFTSNKYLKQHYFHCRIYKVFHENILIKKELEELKTKQKLEISEAKDENKELKLKLDFKEQTINKLEKEILEFKNILYNR
jgi:hypothetical protein